MLGGEIPRRATDATSNIKDDAVGRAFRDIEEELDEVSLGLLLCDNRLGLFGWPVAVVDVLAPDDTRRSSVSRMLQTTD